LIGRPKQRLEELIQNDIKRRNLNGKNPKNEMLGRMAATISRPCWQGQMPSIS